DVVGLELRAPHDVVELGLVHARAPDHVFAVGARARRAPHDVVALTGAARGAPHDVVGLARAGAPAAGVAFLRPRPPPDVVALLRAARRAPHDVVAFTGRGRAPHRVGRPGAALRLDDAALDLVVAPQDRLAPGVAVGILVPRLRLVQVLRELHRAERV